MHFYRGTVRDLPRGYRHLRHTRQGQVVGEYGARGQKCHDVVAKYFALAHPNLAPFPITC